MYFVTPYFKATCHETIPGDQHYYMTIYNVFHHKSQFCVVLELYFKVPCPIAIGSLMGGQAQRSFSCEEFLMCIWSISVMKFYSFYMSYLHLWYMVETWAFM